MAQQTALSVLALPGQVQSFSPKTAASEVALAMTVTDNGDGTATYAVVGGTATRTYYVKTQTVDGELGTQTWTQQDTGTVDGNGEATGIVTIDAGFYWWFYYEEAGGDPVAFDATNIVYQNVTDGTDSVWKQCLDAIQTRIQGLTLSGIANDSVVIRKLPWDRNLTKPAVIVSPAPERINANDGTNAKDERGYGCMVSLYRVANTKLESDLDTSLMWRQQVSKAFLNQRLPGVSEVYRCFVEPGEPFIPAAFAAHYDAQFLIVRPVAQEGRGVS